MAWKIGPNLAELQKDNRQTLIIDGKKILFILNNEQIHAVQAQCPHFKLPLTNGKINQENELVCPFHKSAFDLTSGEVKCWSPWPAGVGALLGKLSKPKKLTVYATRIEDQQVFVDV